MNFQGEHGDAAKDRTESCGVGRSVLITTSAPAFRRADLKRGATGARHFHANLPVSMQQRADMDALYSRIPAHILDELVRRIVAVARPDRILVFGSTTHGDTHPDSDIDLLVVKSGVQHRRQLAQEIHRTFFGLAIPVDVIVATPEDLATETQDPLSVIAAAIREGQEIYAA